MCVGKTPIPRGKTSTPGRVSYHSDQIQVWLLLMITSILFPLHSDSYWIILWFTQLNHTAERCLWWRHNGPDGVWNHQPHDCLLNRLFGRRSKKTSNSASLAFVRGIHRGSVNSQHKCPVTRKCFHFTTSSCIDIDYFWKIHCVFEIR